MNLDYIINCMLQYVIKIGAFFPQNSTFKQKANTQILEALKKFLMYISLYKVQVAWFHASAKN